MARRGEDLKCVFSCEVVEDVDECIMERSARDCKGESALSGPLLIQYRCFD
jgi:hypothetical protein